MKAKEFLTENSDWFDISPGGEKLYFESEVIRMMNEYANEALRIHDVIGRSEQFYCLSDPSEGGVKRCKTQCRGCENSENARQ